MNHETAARRGKNRRFVETRSRARHAHVVFVPLGASEVRPGAFRRPEDVPVVPEEPPVEHVRHRAGGIRADVPEGQVCVTGAEETVRQPARSDEEPGSANVRRAEEEENG